MRKIILVILLLQFNSAIFAQLDDIDRNTYKTVKIGDQVWMAENLRVTKFRNGDPIPYIRSIEAWEHTDVNKRSGYCMYKADTALGRKYGFLYNHYAVTDSRNIAPPGWHVATGADWDKLREYVSTSMMKTYKRNEFAPIADLFLSKTYNINQGDFSAVKVLAPIEHYNDSMAKLGFEEFHGLHYDVYGYGGSVKIYGIPTTNLGIISALLSSDPTYWDSVSVHSYHFKKHFFEGSFKYIPATGTDLFGFNGLPAGMRADGGYWGLNKTTYWWTADQDLTGQGMGIQFDIRGYFALVKDYWRAIEFKRTYGMPVRCVKDE